MYQMSREIRKRLGGGSVCREEMEHFVRAFRQSGVLLCAIEKAADTDKPMVA